MHHNMGVGDWADWLESKLADITVDDDPEDSEEPRSDADRAFEEKLRKFYERRKGTNARAKTMDSGV